MRAVDRDLAGRARRPYAAGVITERDIARWRLHSQLLAAPIDGADEVVRSLLAVQAENPSQSAWAVATRTTPPRQGDTADAIADGRGPRPPRRGRGRSRPAPRRRARATWPTRSRTVACCGPTCCARPGTMCTSTMR